MSATIDLKRFRDYFPKSQFRFGEVDGGSELSFPIKPYWLDKMPTNWKEKAVEFTMKILKNTASGDIMIFVKSAGDANMLCGMLDKAMAEYRKTIKATQGGKTSPTEDIPRYVKLHQAGVLDIKKIITHTFGLEEINDAVSLLKSGHAGRIMIKITND